MPLWHAGLTIRSTCKGYGKRFLGLYKFPTTKSKVMTTRHYMPFSRCSIPVTDFKRTELHINNAHFSTTFEAARWETSAAIGLNEHFFRGKMHLMIAQTNVCFLRPLSPFTIVTVQTAFLGITSSGRATAIVQALYDQKNRLAAVGVYTKPWICIKTKKPVPIREGLKRMGKTADELFLLGDLELTSVDELFVVDEETGEKKPTEAFQNMLDRVKRDPMNDVDLGGFEPVNPEHHKLSSTASLINNAAAVANMNYASMVQRKWNSLGKSTTKKKSTTTQ